MANSGKIVSGLAPRLLKPGLDLILDDKGKNYVGVGDRLFEKRSTEKGFYEILKMAGVGMASQLSEGAAITMDSVNQFWDQLAVVYQYQKAARITQIAIEDNQYEAMLPLIADELLKSLMVNRDFQMAKVLNNAFSTTYGDGKALCATDHPLQAGGTFANAPSVDVDLSHDAVESQRLLIDGIYNDDGLLGDYMAQYLVIPHQLRYEAIRIMQSEKESGIMDNDINAIRSDATLKDMVVWKRLTDSDAWFITTDCANGLLFVRRKGMETQQSQDPLNFDTILSARERFAVTVGNARCIVGTAGAA